jgi:carbon storage regulator
MLILSRRRGEQVVVGDDIVVTVVEVKAGVVRLGFKAFADVPIDRMEVRLAKDKIAKRKKGQDDNGTT